MTEMKPDRDERVPLTLTLDEKRLIQRAAAVRDMNVTQWARSILLPEARRILAVSR